MTRYWVVGTVFKGSIDKLAVFSTYQQGKDWSEKLKRTTYKGVHKETEIIILSGEIDNPDSFQWY